MNHSSTKTCRKSTPDIVLGKGRIEGVEIIDEVDLESTLQISVITLH